MSEDTVQEPVNDQEKAPDAITAFIVIKIPDGSYIAVSDLSKTFTVGRTATLTDIRQACDELRYTILKADIANSVISGLNKPEDSSTND